MSFWFVLDDPHQHTDAAGPALLRARGERPYHRCAAEEPYDLSPPHSITLSARNRKNSGIAVPMARAVLRLTTRHYEMVHRTTAVNNSKVDEIYCNIGFWGSESFQQSQAGNLQVRGATMSTDKSVSRHVGRGALSSGPAPKDPSRGTGVSRRRSAASTAEKDSGALTLIAAHPIFGALRNEDLRLLSAIAAFTILKPGHVIFKKGDADNSLYAIRSGSVKIAAPGEDGREAMFNVLSEGELFGEVALLDGQPRTADAVAIMDCELVTLSRSDFLQLLQREPKVAIKIIELLCARLRAAGEHFEDVLFLNAAERLARTLLRLPYKTLPSNSRRVTITQQEINQMIGLSRESTNKQLRAWEARGWLKIVRGGVVLLDLDAIANAARHDAGQHAF